MIIHELTKIGLYKSASPSSEESYENSTSSPPENYFFLEIFNLESIFSVEFWLFYL